MRTAVVTGATGGIGQETARGLVDRGYHVVLVARSAEKAAATRAEIGGSTDVVLADLSLLADVRRAAAELRERLDRLDVLVLNAGIQVRKQERTAEGNDVMLATNHLAPFLLTRELLPLLEASAPSRVVVVASEAHKFSKLHLDDLQATRGYGILGMPRYGETKLMNLLFVRELAARLDGTGVTVNAVHPGAVATNLGSPPAFLRPIVDRVLKSPAAGAVTSIVVATDPSLDGVSGGYFIDGTRADRKLNRHAQDATLARQLWDASAALVDQRP